ncbi:hypothetical protein [Lysobacter gummosus]|uniref:hypothetical protein n=1 Tax=Lysobacter gummosus TaxID=262324 RepID=UPI00362B1D10
MLSACSNWPLHDRARPACGAEHTLHRNRSSHLFGAKRLPHRQRLHCAVSEIAPRRLVRERASKGRRKPAFSRGDSPRGGGRSIEATRARNPSRLTALSSIRVSGAAAMGEKRFFLIATAATLLVAGVAILTAFVIIEPWRGGVP